MTDEIERLEADYQERLRAEIVEAAHLSNKQVAEIERLRADFNDCNTERVRWRNEAEQLRAEITNQADLIDENCVELDVRKAEIERLRAEIEALRLETGMYEKEFVKLKAEIERLLLKPSTPLPEVDVSRRSVK